MPARMMPAMLLALLISIPAIAQDINSQLIEAAKKGDTVNIKALLEATWPICFDSICTPRRTTCSSVCAAASPLRPLSNRRACCRHKLWPDEIAIAISIGVGSAILWGKDTPARGGRG